MDNMYINLSLLGKYTVGDNTMIKKRDFIEDGKIVKKNRVTILKEPTHGFSLAKCDLCDEEKYPMISWHCEHDDNYIATIVCTDCLCELAESIPESEESNE